MTSVLLARNDNDLVRWEVCQIVRPDTKANADLIINNESVSKDLLEKNSNKGEGIFVSFNDDLKIYYEYPDHR